MSGARHNYPERNPHRRSSVSQDDHRWERYSNVYDVDDRQSAPHRSVPRSIPGSRHADTLVTRTLDDADSDVSESTSSNADSDDRYASLAPERRQLRRSRAIAGDEDSPWSSVNVRTSDSYSRTPSNDTYAASVPRHSSQRNPRKSQSHTAGGSDIVDKYRDSRARTYARSVAHVSRASNHYDLAGSEYDQDINISQSLPSRHEILPQSVSTSVPTRRLSAQDTVGSPLQLPAYDQSYGHVRTRQLPDLATSDTRLREIAEHQTVDMKDLSHRRLGTAIPGPKDVRPPTTRRHSDNVAHGPMSGPAHARRRHSVVAGTQDKDGRSSSSRHRSDSTSSDRGLEPSTSVRHLPDTVSSLSRQLSRRDHGPPSRHDEDESSSSPDREIKSGRQRDKTRRHVSRHDDPSLSRSPPTSYPMDYMDRRCK
jgi:hypothetical protein